MSELYEFNVKDIGGNEISLSKYSGKVLLIVNTASACGFTPQYADLESLYQKYKDSGLEVLAFPCNQFGKQEKGSDFEIKEFCDLKFKVTFPLFSKIDVNGESAIPVYKYLKNQLRGLMGTQKIKWNFTKFLVDKNGKPVKRFSSATSIKDIEPSIKKLL